MLGLTQRPSCHVSCIHPSSTPVTPPTFLTVFVLNAAALASPLTALIIPIYVDTSLVVLGAIRSRMRKSTAPNPAAARTQVRRQDFHDALKRLTILVQRVEWWIGCSMAAER